MPSWKDVPQHIKARFPAPPERDDYSTDDDFLEARGYWQSHVGRNIGLAVQRWEASQRDTDAIPNTTEPAKDPNEDEPLFGGSYIDGCDVDLVEWCGLELVDEQLDKLWGEINANDLLEEAGACVVIEEAIDDAPPGMNDTYYSVLGDEDELKEGLKREILAIINGD